MPIIEVLNYENMLSMGSYFANSIAELKFKLSIGDSTLIYHTSLHDENRCYISSKPLKDEDFDSDDKLTVVIIKYDDKLQSTKIKYTKEEMDLLQCDCNYSLCKYCNASMRECCIDDHYTICQSAPKTCPLGCKLTTKELGDHISKCPHNTGKAPGNFICKFCNLEMPESYEEDHYEVMCQDATMICYVCYLLVKRKDLANHFHTCKNYLIHCRSCKYRPVRYEYTQHMCEHGPNPKDKSNVLLSPRTKKQKCVIS
eukprot:TRINITY_DN8861_c0_g1_i1.p1 TRINITY_DN8861_c0_g1~~TRINITY_DN8861_c0_g1_i1.p1  ORF type:complete len:256 (+),score=8.41 TRINITY_DN8861_c0_g1_i1:100-867(+)